MYSIYKITNSVTKKFYVGFTIQTPSQRWRKHVWSAKRGSKLHLHSSIRKYGESAFFIEVLEEGKNPEVGKNTQEPHWIATLNPAYNKTKGGDGTLGYRHTEDFKQRASVRMSDERKVTGKFRWHIIVKNRSTWAKSQVL